MIHFRFTFSFFILLFVFTFSRSLAQTSLTPSSPWGTWLIATVQLPAGEKKWGGFAEVQGRANSVFSQFFYNELKSGVSYDLDKNFTLTVAGGRYATYDFRALSDGRWGLHAGTNQKDYHRSLINGNSIIIDL